MKESESGRVVHYEASDYNHRSFEQVIEDISLSNAKRYAKPVPAFSCFCEVCPDRPGFHSIKDFQEHDKSNIDNHRRLLGAK